MPQEGQFLFADVFTCQNPRQHQVQHRYRVVQGAGRHPQQGHLSQVGHQEHGAGEHRGAIMHFGGPGLANGVAGDIVRVHAHAAGKQQQIATLGPDGCGWSGQWPRRHPGAKSRAATSEPRASTFSAENRGEAVLDQAVIDFVAGNNQAGPGLVQGLNRRPPRRFAGDGRGPFNGGPLHDEGNGPGGRHFLAFLHRHVVVQGGAHDLIHQVKGGQSRDVHL